MSDASGPTLVPPDNVLDLDAYRQRRIDEGTWPTSREEYVRFFLRWKESRKK